MNQYKKFLTSTQRVGRFFCPLFSLLFSIGTHAAPSPSPEAGQGVTEDPSGYTAIFGNNGVDAVPFIQNSPMQPEAGAVIAMNTNLIINSDIALHSNNQSFIVDTTVSAVAVNNESIQAAQKAINMVEEGLQ